MRKPAKRISKVNDQVRELAERLRSMWAARGIGLAAPQVGVHQQPLVIDLIPRKLPTLLGADQSEIVATSGALDTYEEGCLSIPGVYLTVVRPSQVDVTATSRPAAAPQSRRPDGPLHPA